jgi:hypothetical protein
LGSDTFVICSELMPIIYNRTRTHLSLDKDSPASPAIERIGRICPVPILGGLHRRCVRI